MFHHPTIKWVCTLIALFFIQLCYSQTAVTDTHINGDLYLVSLTNTQGMYSLSISHGDSLLKRAETPNLNPVFIHNQLRKAICLKNKNTDQNCSVGSLGVSDTLLREKASSLFIDLVYTFANKTEEDGQKIAELKLSRKIPAYQSVKFHKSDEIKLDSAKNSWSFMFGGEDYTTESRNVRLFLPKRRWHKKKYKKKNRSAIITVDSLIPEKCDIIFENGFIASIIVSGKLNGRSVRFSSQYGIGVTTRQNVLEFNNIRLFDELGNTSLYLLLSEVIEYSRIIDVYTRDYSPRDKKITLNLEETEAFVYKAPRSKLLAFKVYSDFLGVNDDNPNGLVQVEMDKRINLWTKRVRKYSFATFLNPYFEWSKIEENNRTLFVSTLNEIQYTSPLEVYQYSNMESGIVMNLLEREGSVVGFQANLFPAFTFTSIADSLISSGEDVSNSNQRINSLIAGGELKLTFLPEKALSFVVSTKTFYYWNLNTSVCYKSLNQGIKESTLESPKRLLNDISLILGLRLGDDYDNRIFGRFGFIHEFLNWNNNFAQIQIGYSMYLKTAAPKK